jgi:hypothetical protein
MSKRQEEEGRVPTAACQVEEGVGEGPDWQKRAAGGWHHKWWAQAVRRHGAPRTGEKRG